jgi:hypothetical protein
MLEADRYRSAQEIAEAEKVDRAYVSRLLDLTPLTPEIQEAILEGPKVPLARLREPFPVEWDVQFSTFIRPNRARIVVGPCVKCESCATPSGRARCWQSVTAGGRQEQERKLLILTIACGLGIRTRGSGRYPTCA